MCRPWLKLCSKMLRKLLLFVALLAGTCVYAKDFNEKKIVANLAVISDTHVNGINGVPGYKFRSALIQERDYASRYGKLDGVVVVGDLVDSPAWNASKYTEINDWKRLYESVFSPVDVPLAYTVGNHDVWKEWTTDTYKEAKQFPQRLGPDFYTAEIGDPAMAEKFECRHYEIGGYHILSVVPDGRNPVIYPEESIRWLDENLKALTDKDPQKYVIVITHAMIYGTIYGSFLDDTYPKGKGYWSTKVLTDVLSKYPQAVVFGGHLHFPLNDPRSVWQGAFTVMGTASTRYMAIDNGGYEEMAGLTVMKDKDEFSQGLLLQFDNKGNMRAVRMDFYNQTTIGKPWVFKRPSGDGAHLRKYNHGNLAADNKAPRLSGMKVRPITGAVVVSWPAGQDDEFVHTYYLTVKQGDTVVCTKKILSDFYHTPKTSGMKKDWQQVVKLPRGEYTVTLVARDSWDAESNVLTEEIVLL